MAMLNSATYLTLPLLRPGRHLTQDMYVIYGLEPMLESPNYEIATVMMNRLREILMFHIMNINLRNKVERELRFMFVNDFIFMMLAFVTELVGGFKNTMLQLPFSFSAVFINCYFGQRLIDASTAFEIAI
ncbi:uncharacterized protein LOC133319304 [Danaus plexippus]|uniref:uncharacterized protein LOC133319304 n=1 Tax=Danaus plexippus TaxID=13037 RepID=UPI002AB12F99|nr:uncharacterized protein LOC133319304 [Danaus plexippus]